MIGQPHYLAALVHRVSGLALAVFLPLHFWALGLALEGEARLDAFLAWTQHPLLKASEVLLVAALSVHLAGGIRILAIEFLPWRGGYPGWIGAGFGATLLVALVFALNLA